MQSSGNTMLITGGGSGIGRSLARRFHDQGNSVIIAGRRDRALAETSEGRANMTAMVLDVEDRSGLQPFIDRLVADHPALNVLINNAGVMRAEDATARRDLGDCEAMIETNLMGPIRLIDRLIDHLSSQPDAAIVNVSSGLAFVPLAGFPTYSATKAAVHSYTVSLREQLAGQVEVIEIAPPGVQTDVTPGQATRAGFMSLEDYIDEVMILFVRLPTRTEILVEQVKLLRMAEAEGRFDQVLAMINGPH